MRWPLALAFALAACADNRPVVQPIIDVPVNAEAQAIQLDQLTMSVAHDGAAVDLASATFTHGQTVQLAGVPFADDLVVHLTGLVGQSELAYGRTCSFAIASSGPVPQPHLFFAREVKFAQLDVPRPEQRSGGAAITYYDGSGLILGGVDPTLTNEPIADIFRFDPRTGEMRLLVTTMFPRIQAVAATVGTGADAQVALIGGLDPSTGGGADFVELIDADNPSGNRIDRVDDTNMARVGLTATTLTDGRVIAIGGKDPTTGLPKPDVDEVTLANGTAQVRPLQAMLAAPRYDHTATRLGDDVGAPVLIAGGFDATGMPIAKAELFKPLNGTFSTTFTYAMSVPRANHHAVRMADGSVLIIGGTDKSGNPITTLEVFTQDAGFLPLLQPLPSTAGLTDFAVTTLPDGRVLITGGRDATGTPVNTARIAQLDPVSGSVDVLATAAMSFARAGHQATLLCDGTVLITGGTADPTEVPERYNPPSVGRR
jgi:hypothetical protein